MNILMTNDDGVHSQGIITLAKVFAPHHNIWVVAPSTQQSGKSHGITLHSEVVFRELASQKYSCEGTPADCVLYSLGGALELRPDLVISGINEGYNVGTDIVYSGTLGAAREAHLRGIPAIALSSGDPSSIDNFTHLAEIVLNNLHQLMELSNCEFLVNINYPRIPASDMKAKFTTLGIQYYEDTIHSETAEEGGASVITHRISGAESGIGDNSSDTDVAVTRNGHLSISRVAGVFPSDTDLLVRYPLSL